MNLRTQFTDIDDLMCYLPDDLTCTRYLEMLRWNGKPNCPHCLSTNSYKFKNQKHYKCKECSRKYTVTIGTIFEGTKISLRKWFIAIYLTISADSFIPTTKLARQLDITPKSASSLMKRIHFALETNGIVSTPPNRVTKKNSKNQETKVILKGQMSSNRKTRSLSSIDQPDVQSIV